MPLSSFAEISSSLSPVSSESAAAAAAAADVCSEERQREQLRRQLRREVEMQRRRRRCGNVTESQAKRSIEQFFNNLPYQQPVVEVKDKTDRAGELDKPAGGAHWSAGKSSITSASSVSSLGPSSKSSALFLSCENRNKPNSTSQLYSAGAAAAVEASGGCWVSESSLDNSAAVSGNKQTVTMQHPAVSGPAVSGPVASGPVAPGPAVVASAAASQAAAAASAVGVFSITVPFTTTAKRSFDASSLFGDFNLSKGKYNEDFLLNQKN